MDVEEAKEVVRTMIRENAGEGPSGRAGAEAAVVLFDHALSQLETIASSLEKIAMTMDRMG